MTVAYGLQQVLNLFHIFDLRDFQHIGIFIVRILKIDKHITVKYRESQVKQVT